MIFVVPQFRKKDKSPVVSEDEFVCTICAQIFFKTHLSKKSEPKERDTCTQCNKLDDENIETIEEEPGKEHIEVAPAVINKVERFLIGDGYQNGRLASTSTCVSMHSISVISVAM